MDIGASLATSLVIWGVTGNITGNRRHHWQHCWRSRGKVKFIVIVLPTFVGLKATYYVFRCLQHPYKGLLGIKIKNVWEKYINLIYLFNKKCYSKKLFAEV